MNDLSTIVKASSLDEVEQGIIFDQFGNYEEVAQEWTVKAKQIVVTSAEQKTEIEMAKVAKKKFADMRIEIEKTRKALKEQSLRKGQAIDAVAKYLQSLIAPIEEHLRLQADYVKIQAEREAERLRAEAEREAERLRAENNKRYMDWIEANGYREGVDILKREGNTYTIYRAVSSITL